MSQYPSPYLPPNMPLSYAVPPDPLAASKRASWLLFILGPLGLMLGTCLFAMPMLLKAVPAQQADQLRDQTMQATHMTLESFFPTMGVIFAVPSLLMLLFAFFVRRGNRGATFSAGILVALAVAFWTLNVLGSIFLQPINPQSLIGVCFGAVLIAVFGLEMYFLIRAFRASGQAAIAQQQYAAQYWQYQQNMQAYAYAQQQQPQGYPPPQTYPTQGYAIAPSPPPPEAPATNHVDDPQA